MPLKDAFEINRPNPETIANTVEAVLSGDLYAARSDSIVGPINPNYTLREAQVTAMGIRVADCLQDMHGIDSTVKPEANWHAQEPIDIVGFADKGEAMQLAAQAKLLNIVKDEGGKLRYELSYHGSSLIEKHGVDHLDVIPEVEASTKLAVLAATVLTFAGLYGSHRLGLATESLFEEEPSGFDYYIGLSGGLAVVTGMNLVAGHMRGLFRAKRVHKQYLRSQAS